MISKCLTAFAAILCGRSKRTDRSAVKKGLKKDETLVVEVLQIECKGMFSHRKLSRFMKIRSPIRKLLYKTVRKRFPMTKLKFVERKNAMKENAPMTNHQSSFRQVQTFLPYHSVEVWRQHYAPTRDICDQDTIIQLGLPHYYYKISTWQSICDSGY